MGAPEGNQFWKLRTTHGRDLLFSSPTILWEACCEYFEATDTRKWNKAEIHGKDPEMFMLPNETPYTWTGLYLFLDIVHSTWQEYEKKEDFKAITARVRNIIYTQKLEGAAVGAFNANIIARDLQLKDSSDITSNGEKIAHPLISVYKDGEQISLKIKSEEDDKKE